MELRCMMFTAQAHDLDKLATAGRRRRLTLPAGIDFASNDYLGFAGQGRLRNAALEALEAGAALGSGGSRLLRGHHPEHEELETAAARMFGAEAALFFGSGFAANGALFSALPQRGDLVLHDALIHASVHDGLRAGRAETEAFAHNDVGAAADALDRYRARGGVGRVFLAVESLYSMDGDVAPLADFKRLADQHEAILVIDEAHAVGVFGERGQGLAAGLDGAENVITLRTLGKALGCEGALLFLPKVAKDFLINRARAFIFSTAPSPFSARLALSALRLSAEADDLRAELHARIHHARTRLAPLGLPLSQTQIQPLILGDEARSMAAAARLQAEGFDIRGVRPPTVPAGTSRLRLSLTLNVEAEAVDRLADLLPEILA